MAVRLTIRKPSYRGDAMHITIRAWGKECLSEAAAVHDACTRVRAELHRVKMVAVGAVHCKIEKVRHGWWRAYAIQTAEPQ